MKSLHKVIKIPAKTYLLGEYVALTGGPALIMSHGPEFKCTYPGNTPITHVFHPESPAGILIQHHKLQNLLIDWYDPYNNTGGLGGSGAEFIASYLLVNNLSLSDADPWHIRASYLDILQETKIKTLPSGYDIIAQCNPGINFIEANSKTVKHIHWPFLDCKINIYKTNIKTKTHEHLADNFLLDGIIIKKLEDIVLNGLNSLQNNNLSRFCTAINEYHSILNTNNFVHPEITKVIKYFQEAPDILAAKGCGALCSDVIITLHQVQQRPKSSIQDLKGIDIDLITVL